MGLLSGIKKVFTGGGASALDVGGKILDGIDNLSTSAEEKAQLRQTVVTSMVAAQSTVLVAEAQAGGISARWRPITMLTFVALIVCHYALFPMIAVIWPASAAVFAAMSLPPELWILIQVGLGGYIGGRSVEKLTQMVMPNMKMAKLKKKLLKKLDPEQIKELLDEE